MAKSQDKKILIVDDEPDILEFMQYNLRKEGYDVYTASNGIEALSIAKAEIPHLIILDIMMPEMDGIETCRNLKEINALDNSIITFLTARNEDYSQIAGFDVGADDYITKPIKPRVLISRIKALLRRTEKKQENQILQIGNLTIDRDRYLIVQDNNEIALPRKEFELLALLISKPGKVFKREDIMNMVWGEDVVVGDRTIDVHIRKIREKLGDGLIKTVKGIGYKFDLN
ncbi:MAG: response regulator transcription factor [Bacteroidia bacterium]|nr:response regulator transcription factor [Bacteroidia bacterium]